jgi:membrane fusion protein (multidrug efflux system)
MRTRARRLLLYIGGGAVLAALALFILGRFGVLPLPWSPTPAKAETAAADSAAVKTDGEEGEDEKIIPVPVELAAAVPRAISAYYRASSVLEADRHVELVSRAAGRVQTVRVEEGDWVRAEQTLAELENGRERIGLRQAELRLAEQKRELDRRELLLEKNLITEEEFESTRSAYAIAETERDLARIALEETFIRAPFDGQITDRLIVPGQHVNTLQPLFTLVDFEPLRVRIHLPETVARRISPGEEVFVSAESKMNAIPATVERIAPVVDPATSTVRLTLRLAEFPEELRVGGFVKARITTDTHLEALAIPKIALVEEGGLRSVFVAAGDSVRKIEVRTGLYDEEYVEILDGVEEDEFVVAVGQGGLRSGSRIEVLNADDVGWTEPADAATAAEENPTVAMTDSAAKSDER